MEDGMTTTNTDRAIHAEVGRCDRDGCCVDDCVLVVAWVDGDGTDRNVEFHCDPTWAQDDEGRHSLRDVVVGETRVFDEDRESIDLAANGVLVGLLTQRARHEAILWVEQRDRRRAS